MKYIDKLYIVVVCLFCMAELYSQEEITEVRYLEQDSILWADFETCQEKLNEYWDSMPDKRDSIQEVYNEIYRKTSEKILN